MHECMCNQAWTAWSMKLCSEAAPAGNLSAYQGLGHFQSSFGHGSLISDEGNNARMHVQLNVNSCSGRSCTCRGFSYRLVFGIFCLPTWNITWSVLSIIDGSIITSYISKEVIFLVLSMCLSVCVSVSSLLHSAGWNIGPMDLKFGTHIKEQQIYGRWSYKWMTCRHSITFHPVSPHLWAHFLSWGRSLCKPSLWNK